MLSWAALNIPAGLPYLCFVIKSVSYVAPQQERIDWNSEKPRRDAYARLARPHRIADSDLIQVIVING